MAKLMKSQPNHKEKLSKISNGRVDKSKKKRSQVNGKVKKRPVSELVTDDDLVIRKKPPKAELKSAIELLKKDPKPILVRKVIKYIPSYMKSEGLIKKLLKEIIRLWAEGVEKVRVLCLLCLIRIYIKLKDKERRHVIVKQLYNTFLEKSRVTKHETMSMIVFMRHSLVELYKLDTGIAFKKAQTSCQQLSVTLKNAQTHKNEETYKSVLNWQYANCVILLSNLVSCHDDPSIRSLTNQVIQLNLGALNLMISPRYYPYYCHLIGNLINLSRSTNLFIPIIPQILVILNRLSMPLDKKKDSKDKPMKGLSGLKNGDHSTKRRQSKEAVEGSESDDDGKDSDDNDDDDNNCDGSPDKESKHYDMELLNHVSLDEAHLSEYQVAVLNKLYELLLSYLSSQCHKIAFPELVLLSCVHIKKWLKKNPGLPTQKLKPLLDKVKSDCQTIEESRRTIDFAFTNFAAVDAWERRMRESGKLKLPKTAEKELVSSD